MNVSFKLEVLVRSCRLFSVPSSLLSRWRKRGLLWALLLLLRKEHFARGGWFTLDPTLCCLIRVSFSFLIFFILLLCHLLFRTTFVVSPFYFWMCVFIIIPSTWFKFFDFFFELFFTSHIIPARQRFNSSSSDFILVLLSYIFIFC